MPLQKSATVNLALGDHHPETEWASNIEIMTFGVDAIVLSIRLQYDFFRKSHSFIIHGTKQPSLIAR
jgi:hypothetical protein